MTANHPREPPQPHARPEPEQRRDDILAYVARHPGCSLRRAAGGATLCLTVARYHVRVLEKCQALQVYRKGATWSLFPAGYRLAAPSVAGLQGDPDLVQLWDWLQAHGESVQQDVVHEASSWGWTRTTTLRRLRRLTEAGAIQRVKRAGRLVAYRSLLRSGPVPDATEAIDVF